MLWSGLSAVSIAATQIDIGPLLPVLIALAGGGGVAWYTARERKESIIVEASEKAMVVVSQAVKQLEKDLREARDRVTTLEAQLDAVRDDRDRISGELVRVREQVVELKVKLGRLGVYERSDDPPARRTDS